MAFLFTVVCLWLVGRTTALPAASFAQAVASCLGPNWRGSATACRCCCAGAGYLRVFRPALMSNDSLGQWAQMLSGEYTDIAPAFHTMTNWLMTRIWFSPAAIAWTQLMAMSLVVAWTLKRLRQWGLARGLGLGSELARRGSCRRRASFTITLWKDIPYTIAFLISAWVMETSKAGAMAPAAGLRVAAGPGPGA